MGKWRITMWDIEYIVDIIEFSNLANGGFRGPYIVHGCQHGIGFFNLRDVTKLEKMS